MDTFFADVETTSLYPLPSPVTFLGGVSYFGTMLHSVPAWEIGLDVSPDRILAEVEGVVHELTRENDGRYHVEAFGHEAVMWRDGWQPEGYTWMLTHNGKTYHLRDVPDIVPTAHMGVD
jgi:hypothetical protein